jgi:hypothetical protein
MKSLEVSGAVRPLYGSLGVKGLAKHLPRCDLPELGATYPSSVVIISIILTQPVYKM